MITTRREVLKSGAMAAGTMALGRIPAAMAQGKELNVVGATFNLLDVIL